MALRRASKTPAARFPVVVRIAAPAWKDGLPGVATLVRRAVRRALLEELPPRAGTELTVLLTDDAEMRRLNTDWRGKRKPTNVLSFPAEAALDPARPPAYLGDIALGYGICAAEARAAGRPLADHVAHLAVHGVLHLLGYDHVTDEQAAAMEPREIELLAQLGIPDPYAPTGRGRALKRGTGPTKPARK